MDDCQKPFCADSRCNTKKYYSLCPSHKLSFKDRNIQSVSIFKADFRLNHPVKYLCCYCSFFVSLLVLICLSVVN